jgi:hypothetical protein
MTHSCQTSLRLPPLCLFSFSGPRLCWWWPCRCSSLVLDTCQFPKRQNATTMFECNYCSCLDLDDLSRSRTKSMRAHVRLTVPMLTWAPTLAGHRCTSCWPHRRTRCSPRPRAIAQLRGQGKKQNAAHTKRLGEKHGRQQHKQNAYSKD